MRDRGASWWVVQKHPLLLFSLCLRMPPCRSRRASGFKRGVPAGNVFRRSSRIETVRTRTGHGGHAAARMPRSRRESPRPPCVSDGTIRQWIPRPLPTRSAHLPFVSAPAGTACPTPRQRDRPLSTPRSICMRRSLLHAPVPGSAPGAFTSAHRPNYPTGQLSRRPRAIELDRLRRLLCG